MPHKAKTEELLAYHPRRCNRCWYWDKKDGTCHGNEAKIVKIIRSEGNRLELRWPYTPKNSFCRHYFPRAHGERDTSVALPNDMKPKGKKKSRKR